MATSSIYVSAVTVELRHCESPLMVCKPWIVSVRPFSEKDCIFFPEWNVLFLVSIWVLNSFLCVYMCMCRSRLTCVRDTHTSCVLVSTVQMLVLGIFLYPSPLCLQAESLPMATLAGQISLWDLELHASLTFFLCVLVSELCPHVNRWCCTHWATVVALVYSSSQMWVSPS